MNSDSNVGFANDGRWIVVMKTKTWGHRNTGKAVGRDSGSGRNRQGPINSQKMVF